MGMNEEEGHAADELTVSGDGSWARRGFSSLFGIVSLIGKYTNKLLDVVVKSRVCRGCLSRTGKTHTVEYAAWYDDHQEHCDANHEGSSGKMKVDGMIEMFQRSEELYNIKYANYIGDGDPKTFKSLIDVNPYGEDLVIRKSECVLHVTKRLYKRGTEAKKKYAQLQKAKKQLSEKEENKKMTKNSGKKN